MSDENLKYDDQRLVVNVYEIGPRLASTALAVLVVVFIMIWFL